MNTPNRLLKKSYAMQRMAGAIERAVEAPTSKEKERAARWVAAWGMLCGIKTSTVRLRRSDVSRESDERSSPRSSDRIQILAATSRAGNMAEHPSGGGGDAGRQA